MIYLDGDACPVKKETYRVAKRYGLRVALVANSRIHAPTEPWIETVVVDRGFDAADDWIAERAADHDVVITDDILLAQRCVASGARVVTPRGRELTADSIGAAVATRELLADLREMGEVTGGPAPFTPRDRSQFLQRLDAIVQRIRRERNSL